MRHLIFLTLMLSCTSVFSQTTEELIFQLGSDSYGIRERANECLKVRMKESLNDFELVRLAQVHEDLEVRSRAKRLINGHYLPMFIAGDYPIWSIPDNYRFVNNEDIALKYYLRAYKSFHPNQDCIYYNHDGAMFLATRLYFFDWLNSRDSRVGMSDLIKSMASNYKTETCICDRLSICDYQVFTVPLSFRGRIQELNEGLKKDACFMPNFIFN